MKWPRYYHSCPKNSLSIIPSPFDADVDAYYLFLQLLETDFVKKGIHLFKYQLTGREGGT